MESAVGSNQRFLNQNLYLGKPLNEAGFGRGEAGLEAAKKAALNHPGSELISQDAQGDWHVQEIGEARNAQSRLKPLSEIDQAEIHLDQPQLARRQAHQAFISFLDTQPEKPLPANLATMSAWQKLKTGNQMVAQALVHKAGLAVTHPVRTASDLAGGLISNTYTTLRHPGQAWDQVQASYQQDPVEGVITGVRSFGAVVASAALVTGATAAVVSMGSGYSSLKIGRAMTALGDKATLETLIPLYKNAQTVSLIGAQAGRIGFAAGQVGKVAGGTLIVATGASLLKNQYDLSQSQTQAQMHHEVQQLTQDTSSLAQTAAFYLANDVLRDVAKIAKRLYIENRAYPPLPPESEQFLNQLIAEKSQKIAQRVVAEVPDLHPEKWDKLGIQEKQQALQALNQVIGEELQFQTAPLAVQDLGPNMNGGYHPPSNQVFLNPRLLGSAPGMVNTLTHEQFHAFQNLLVKTFQEQNQHGNLLLQTQIDAWRQNLKNYATPMNTPSLGPPGKEIISRDAMGLVFPGFDNSIEYRAQPLEKSAWAIGDATEASFIKALDPQPAVPPQP